MDGGPKIPIVQFDDLLVELRSEGCDGASRGIRPRLGDAPRTGNRGGNSVELGEPRERCHGGGEPLRFGKPGKLGRGSYTVLVVHPREGLSRVEHFAAKVVVSVIVLGEDRIVSVLATE